MLPIFALFQILKTINCFFTSKSLYFKKYIQRGKTQSTLAELASIQNPARVVPGPQWHQAWLLILPNKRQHTWPSASEQQWCHSAGSHSRQLKHGQSWAVGLTARDCPGLTCWAYRGVCKAFLGFILAFKVRSLRLKEKRKKLNIERVSGGWVTPKAEPHFPAWPGGWEWK